MTSPCQANSNQYVPELQLHNGKVYILSQPIPVGAPRAAFILTDAIAFITMCSVKYPRMC